MRDPSDANYGKTNSRIIESAFELVNWRSFGMCIGSSSARYLTDPWARNLVLIKFVLNKGCTNIKVEFQETNAVKAAGIFCLWGVGFSVGTYIVCLLLRWLNLKFMKKRILCSNCLQAENLNSKKEDRTYLTIQNSAVLNRDNILRRRINTSQASENYDYIKCWLNSCDANKSYASFVTSQILETDLKSIQNKSYDHLNQSALFDSLYTSAILPDQVSNSAYNETRDSKFNKSYRSSSLFNFNSNVEDESYFEMNSDDLFSENKSASGKATSLYDFRDSHIRKAYSVDLGEDLRGMTFIGGGSLSNEAEAKLMHLERELLRVQTDVGRLTHQFGALSRSWDDTLMPIGWFDRWTPTLARSFSFESLGSQYVASKDSIKSGGSLRGVANEDAKTDAQDLSWDYQYDLIGRVVESRTKIVDVVENNDGIEWTYSDIGSASAYSSSREMSPVNNHVCGRETYCQAASNLNCLNCASSAIDDKTLLSKKKKVPTATRR